MLPMHGKCCETSQAANIASLSNSAQSSVQCDVHGQAKCPTHLVCTESCVVIENSNRCAFAVTSNFRAWNDGVCVRSNHPIPREADEYYFEMRIIDLEETDSLSDVHALRIGLCTETVLQNCRGPQCLPGLADKSHGWSCLGAVFPFPPDGPDTLSDGVYSANDIVGFGWSRRVLASILRKTAGS